MKVSISLHKTDLSRLAELRGQVNADPLEIEGAIYEPGTVVYVGFQGTHIGAGVYEGQCIFRASQPRDVDADWFVKQDIWQHIPNAPVETDGTIGLDHASDVEIDYGAHGHN